MIVVFVVDTSPSMSCHLLDNSLSKLDLAKMAVESLFKGLTKRIQEHNGGLMAATTASTTITMIHWNNMGLGYSGQDQFLLLSTGRPQQQQQQHANDPAASEETSSTATCGAGGRLLVGFGDYILDANEKQGSSAGSSDYAIHSHQAFERELKKLRATKHPPGEPFPEDGGGAIGLNAALSAGLTLMSRYRLKNRSTENFGMGRLPSPAMLIPSGGATASNALQPACLVVLTDGECLKPNTPGGGSLELQLGNMPLREFYQEPFRWDQRIFVLGVGKEQISSTQFLHPSIRALCEVTGGCHAMLRSASALSQLTDQLIKMIAPPRPAQLPIADPLRLPTTTPAVPAPTAQNLNLPPGTFVQGAPVCCFQALEAGPNGEASALHRAMIFYVPHQSPQVGVQLPTWCLPESFFPSKNLDTLPPRLAQPLLTFSRNFFLVGSSTFDPMMVMKALNHLDQLMTLNRKSQPQHQLKLLQRDVYICEWLSQDGRPASPPSPRGRQEHYPVAVRGAGRSLTEVDEPILNIGILHVPPNATSLSAPWNSNPKTYSTLTLLPPEPHILLPLLVKAADAEHRMLKKYPDNPRPVLLDDAWRSELRAYLFRIPPYYHNALKRCLRPLLPTSVHALLSTEGIEALASQCFSKMCLQKIRAGEQVQKEFNERMERQERQLRRRGVQGGNDSAIGPIGYGQFDPRASTSSYLAALRTMPPPWKVPALRARRSGGRKDDGNVSDLGSVASGLESEKGATEVLGDLPADCLVPFYESRRRWIFGGSGLTTRNVFVDGVCNDGSNSQRCRSNPKAGDESLLAAARVGVSTLNKMATFKMGDYRERLLWTRAPIVGNGSNDSNGVAGTTAPDGSPIWSVDDDALPISFFDQKTGEFTDSVQVRVRSRLTVHFGNPFKDKRGNSLIPEEFLNQRPPRKRVGSDIEDLTPMTPPGSPPHDNFPSVEGEGEAIFASPARKSPQHSSLSPTRTSPPKKRESADNPSPMSEGKRSKKDDPAQKASEKISPDKRPDGPPKPPPPPPGPGISQRPPLPPVPAVSPSVLKKGEAPRKPRPPPPGPPGPPTGKPKPPQRISSVVPSPKAPPLGAPKPPGSKEPPPPKAPPSVHAPCIGKQVIAGPPAAKELATKPQSVAPGKVPPPPSGAPLAQKSHTPVPRKPTPQSDPPTIALGAAVIPQAPTDVQSQDNKPNVNLPPDWIVSWSRSQQRWYYFNKKTNNSLWEWPPPS
jgi:integrator complex subunit 6